MFSLRGVISDRIRRGEIVASKVHRTDEVPSPEAVRGAKGQGLGKGATTRGGNKGAS